MHRRDRIAQGDLEPRARRPRSARRRDGSGRGPRRNSRRTSGTAANQNRRPPDARRTASAPAVLRRRTGRPSATRGIRSHRHGLGPGPPSPPRPHRNRPPPAGWRIRCGTSSSWKAMIPPGRKPRRRGPDELDRILLVEDDIAADDEVEGSVSISGSAARWKNGIFRRRTPRRDAGPDPSHLLGRCRRPRRSQSARPAPPRAARRRPRRSRCPAPACRDAGRPSAATAR